MRGRGPAILLLLLGMGATVASYRAGLPAGFYFDDVPNIAEVESLKWDRPSLAGLQSSLTQVRLPSRPVANLSFGLNHLLLGPEPRAYRLVNLAIHLLVGMAIAWIAVLLGREVSPDGEERTAMWWAAAVGSAVFLLHPLNIQAVTYVVQRMTSLAALFVLLAFGLYLSARRRPPGPGRTALFFLAGSSWLLGLGTKENAVLLVPVLLAYEVCYRRRQWGRRLRTRPLRVGASLVLLLGLGLLTAWLYLDGDAWSWARTFAEREFSGIERVLTQTRVQLFYLSLLLWPSPSRLNLDHHFTVSRSFWTPPETSLAALFWLAAAILAVVLAKRRPRLGFPLCAYLLFHSLEAGPFNLELSFEHRMYLPMAALVWLLVAWVVELRSATWRGVVLGCLVALLVPLGLATHRRNVLWADEMAFHWDVARKSPNKYRPQYNLGTHLGRHGRFFDAIPVLRRALEIDPDSSEAHNQLGTAYLRINLVDRALAEYREATRLDPENAEAVFNTGLLLDRTGRRQEALTHYRRFLEIAPPRLAGPRERVEERVRALEAAGYPSPDGFP